MLTCHRLLPQRVASKFPLYWNASLQGGKRINANEQFHDNLKTATCLLYTLLIFCPDASVTKSLSAL